MGSPSMECIDIFEFKYNFDMTLITVGIISPPKKKEIIPSSALQLTGRTQPESMVGGGGAL